MFVKSKVFAAILVILGGINLYSFPSQTIKIPGFKLPDGSTAVEMQVTQEFSNIDRQDFSYHAKWLRDGWEYSLNDDNLAGFDGNEFVSIITNREIMGGFRILLGEAYRYEFSYENDPKGFMVLAWRSPEGIVALTFFKEPDPDGKLNRLIQENQTLQGKLREVAESENFESLSSFTEVYRDLLGVYVSAKADFEAHPDSSRRKSAFESAKSDIKSSVNSHISEVGSKIRELRSQL